MEYQSLLQGLALETKLLPAEKIPPLGLSLSLSLWGPKNSQTIPQGQYLLYTTMVELGCWYKYQSQEERRDDAQGPPDDSAI